MYIYSYTGTVDCNRMTATCTISKIIRPEFSGEMMDTHVVDHCSYGLLAIISSSVYRKERIERGA